MSVVKKSVSFPEELWAAVEEQAAAQRRSCSNVIQLYLTTDTSLHPVIARTPPPTVGAPPAAKPKPRGVRTATCEHRIPATAYCQVCDR